MVRFHHAGPDEPTHGHRLYRHQRAPFNELNGCASEIAVLYRPMITDFSNH
jgi:hypothetical protein